MSKPIAVITNDWHLKPGNEKKVYRSIEALVDYCLQNEIKVVIGAGDLFDSRSFQRQEVLLTFGRILDLFKKNGLRFIAFPGNHDKSVYSSRDSFLDPFQWHPAMELHSDPTRIVIEGVSIYLVPFFTEDILVKILEKAPKSDVLISHFEMNGSSYLGRVASGLKITREMLKKFKKTYLGHYHDLFEITKNIVHLMSLRQSHFGENNLKGFSVLHEDLSYTPIQGVFEEFIKIEVDLDKKTSKEITDLIKSHSNTPAIVRFELTGDKGKLKAIDREQFRKAGIDVKVKHIILESDLPEAGGEIPIVKQKYNYNDVIQDFKKFCKDKNLNHPEGLVLLNKCLKKEVDE